MDEEDFDLEVLRMAALKSLQKKAVIEAAPHQHIMPPAILSQQPPVYMTSGGGPQSAYPYHQRVAYPAPAMAYTPMPPQVPIVGPPPIVPHLPSIAPSSVQLSPRSAAFVSQNNDILARRHRAKSPPYNRSPGRWSRSPSPLVRKYRRSVSRSPPPRKRSRSPRYANRSPVRRRSPVPRRPSPARNGGRWKSANNSPVQRRRGASRSPVRVRRSPIPVSKSPPAARRLNRNFKPNERRRKTPEKPEKPEKPKIVEEKSRSKSHSLSPAASLERILANMDDEYKIEIDDKHICDDDLLAKIDSAGREPPVQTVEKPAEKPAVVGKEPVVKKPKTEMDLEDELLASDDEDILSADITEMDLFASDDSESEKEGRFKGAEAKTERKTTSIVPFSRLTGPPQASSSDRKRDERRRPAEIKRDERPKTPGSRLELSLKFLNFNLNST